MYSRLTLVIEIGHGDEGLPVNLVNLVNSADIRVLQRCRGFRFPDKAPTAFVVRDQVGSQKLERDGTAELFVDRFVDPTHPAFPKFFEDFVMRDGLAGHGFKVRVNLV